MLRDANRLRHEKDIQTLFSKGKSVFDTSIGMKVRANNLPTTRFTVVVGTKISKRAVDRNRIKRRVRGVIERLAPQLKPGFDVAFLPKLKVQTMPHAELVTSIETLLRKAHLL